MSSRAEQALLKAIKTGEPVPQTIQQAQELAEQRQSVDLDKANENILRAMKGRIRDNFSALLDLEAMKKEIIRLRQKVATMPRAPRVLVIVEGGNIQNIAADGKVSICIKDFDNIEAGDEFDPTDFCYPPEVVSPEQLDQYAREGLNERPAPAPSAEPAKQDDGQIEGVELRSLFPSGAGYVYIAIDGRVHHSISRAGVVSEEHGFHAMGTHYNVSTDPVFSWALREPVRSIVVNLRDSVRQTPAPSQPEQTQCPPQVDPIKAREDQDPEPFDGLS